jgi:hypothetical protein
MESDLTDILELAARDGLTAHALGRSGGQGERTGHRWLGGTAVPKLLTFRRMVSRASKLPRWLKRALLDWLVDGSGFAVVETDPPTKAQLDADGNGTVDDKDASIHYTHAACGLLTASSAAIERNDYALALEYHREAEQRVYFGGEVLRQRIAQKRAAAGNGRGR